MVKVEIISHTPASQPLLRNYQEANLQVQNVTIDSPVLAASVPPQICRSSCNTLSCDWMTPSDTDTFISLTETPIMVLRVAMVPRNTRLYLKWSRAKQL